MKKLSTLSQVCILVAQAVIFIALMWFAYDSTVIALQYEADKAAAIGRGEYK